MLTRPPSAVRRWLATPAALALLSAGVSAQEVVKRWAPHPPASLNGHRFDDLFSLITTLISVSFLIVLILLFIPAFRDRAGPGRRAHFDHGSSLHDKRLTATVSVIVFLVLDALVLYYAMVDLREGYWNIPRGDENAYRVEVLGQQWAWNFRATGPDNEFGTPDDILSINELTVPVDRPVVFNMTSKDVIHSLYVPDMRFKRDANPGAVNEGWFQPIQTGQFAILCAELCGYAHYQMHGQLNVLSQDDFAAWEADAATMAEILYDENDAEADWAWAWQE